MSGLDGPRALPRWVILPGDPPALQRLMLRWKRESERTAGGNADRDAYEQPEDLR